MRTIDVLAAAVAVSFLATPARAELTKCTFEFSLSGWSLIYKQMKGEGKVSCSNGQTASVTISSHGGGFTVGNRAVALAKYMGIERVVLLGTSHRKGRRRPSRRSHQPYGRQSRRVDDRPGGLSIVKVLKFDEWGTAGANGRFGSLRAPSPTGPDDFQLRIQKFCRRHPCELLLPSAIPLQQPTLARNHRRGPCVQEITECF